MPMFEVTEKFWDGAHMHPPGTKVRLAPEKYDKHLSLTMRPLDDQAKKDMDNFRKKCSTARRVARDPSGQIIMKNGQPVVEDVPIEIPRYQQTESGDLNPNDRDDLRTLAQKASEGVEVVETPKQEVVEKVVSLE